MLCIGFYLSVRNRVFIETNRNSLDLVRAGHEICEAEIAVLIASCLLLESEQILSEHNPRTGNDRIR